MRPILSATGGGGGVLYEQVDGVAMGSPLNWTADGERLHV